MVDNPDFLPGIESYGEFRSRLSDAEDAEKISKKSDWTDTDDGQQEEPDDDSDLEDD